MTESFITREDEYLAGSKSPRVIGQMKLNRLNFNIDMTDEEMQSVCADAKAIRDTYMAWETFHRELELRKKRNMGFKAAVAALDIPTAAAAMGTTPDKVVGVMTQYAAAEDARIAELTVLWESGQLPDRDVLGDPSEGVIDPQDPPSPAEEPPADLTDPATP